MLAGFQQEGFGHPASDTWGCYPGQLSSPSFLLLFLPHLSPWMTSRWTGATENSSVAQSNVTVIIKTQVEIETWNWKKKIPLHQGLYKRGERRLDLVLRSSKKSECRQAMLSINIATQGSLTLLCCSLGRGAETTQVALGLILHGWLLQQRFGKQMRQRELMS